MSSRSNFSSTTLPSHRAIDLIVQEHRLVETLFSQYQHSNEIDKKQAIVYDVIKNLCMHSNKEQMTLYPMLRKKVPQKEGKVDHSLEEHMEVEKILYELDNMKVGDEGFDMKFNTLVTNVLHHVQEEESDLLANLPTYFSDAELNTLASEWEAAASTVTTRPHPIAPKEGVMHKAAQMMSKPIDSLRDKARDSAEPSVAERRTS